VAIGDQDGVRSVIEKKAQPTFGCRFKFFLCLVSSLTSVGADESDEEQAEGEASNDEEAGAPPHGQGLRLFFGGLGVADLAIDLGNQGSEFGFCGLRLLPERGPWVSFFKQREFQIDAIQVVGL